MTANYWTDDLVEKLKELWAEGHSASQIARAMPSPHPSRNAVIGKVHRLGLAGRITSTRRTAGLPPLPREQRPPRPKPPTAEEIAAMPEPEPARLDDEAGGTSLVTIQTVSDRTCRWPIGDPQDRDFHFCGRGPKPGSVYCEPHHNKAHQPALAMIARNKQAANGTSGVD